MADRYGNLLFHWRGELYDASGSEELFWKAVRENMAFHQKHNPAYRRLIRRFPDMPWPLPIPADFFKARSLWTMEPKSLPFLVTSSGTGGKKTNLGFCFSDLLRGAKMTLSVTRRHGILSWRPAVYLMLCREPDPQNRTMISRTQKITSFFAPPLKRVYGLCLENGRYRLNMDGLLKALRLAVLFRIPVRVVGFPSYTFFFLEHLKRNGLRYRLPNGSMALLGGGWKGFAGMEPEKGLILRLLSDVLGIPPERYMEFFGAAEHPSLYCGCQNHHFHVPVYSRARVLDAETLRPLPCGEPGLLNLISPLAKGMPLVSVLTGDMAVLHDGSDCGCGIQAPYFELLGRAGTSPGKTCAADAAELFMDIWKEESGHGTEISPAPSGDH